MGAPKSFGIAAGYPMGPGQIVPSSTAPIPLYTAAVAAVRAGTRRGTILCWGDSTTWGQGAGTGANLSDGARVKAYPYKLAQLLNARGIPALQEASFGDSNRFSFLPAYDPRQAFAGSGWFSSGTSTTVGGNGIANSTTTDNMSVTPSIPVDTYRFWVLQGSTVADFYCDVDGANSQVFNSRTTPTAMTAFTKTATLGAHTFNLQRSGGVGTAYRFGFNAYNSAIKQFDVFNAGWSGSTSTENVTGAQPWNPLQAVQNLAPDLTIINTTLNDMILGTVNITTRQANVQLEINAAKISGNVVVAAPNPVSTSVATQLVQEQNRDMLKALAAQNGLRFLDILALFGGSYTAAVANGFMGADPIHPLEAGYTLIASAYDALINS